MSKLPNDLKGLIEVAIIDCEKVLNNPKIVFAMGTWLDKFGDTCNMCVAGAVLYDLGYNSGYEAFGCKELDAKTDIIDYVRSGDYKFTTPLGQRLHSIFVEHGEPRMIRGILVYLKAVVAYLGTIEPVIIWSE